MDKIKNRFLLIIILITSITYSQEELPQLKIFHKVDDMTNKEYYYSSRRLVYVDTITKSGKLEAEGLGANLTFSKKKDEVIVDGFDIICTSIGCMENSKLIILFENDSKIERTSWNKFNCDGKAYFMLSKKDIELLSNTKVKKIRITNGRNFKSVTGEIKETDYFINTISLLRNKEFTIKE